MPVKIDGQTVRGYKVEQFADAFHRVLGVTRVTSVTSESRSQAEGNAGNAGNALHAGGGTTGPDIPTFGDALYLDHIAAAHREGQVTTIEALACKELHDLVLRGDAKELAA